MPTKRLPAIDSFDYEYLLYKQRRLANQAKNERQRRKRRLVARTLHRLAEAMAFLQNGTIQRGMQLELH